MGFWSWLTGRDKTQSDLYANYERVSQVNDELGRIATSQMGDAREAVSAALQQLNNVPGFAEYVTTINVSTFDAVFDQLGDTVKQIGTQLNQKAEDIKKYEESPWYEKVASTVTMGIFKVGEGLLSVVEDLGDGIVSLVGWGAGALGAKDFQQDCANFVKKEWSHDAFNFYYNSDFAKASAITEDSAIAGGLKIAGKVVGYLYAGGAIGGALKAASGVATVGSGIFAASTSTVGATIAAGIGGIGSGTESGLNQGLDYNDAMKVGLKTGATSAALAYAGGKISEASQAKQVLQAQNGGAKVSLKDALSTHSYTDAAGNVVNIQGYTDAISRAGERFGEASVNTVKSGANVLRARTGLKTGDPQLKVDYDDAVNAFKNDLSTLKAENPLSQSVNGLKSAGSSAKTFVQNFSLKDTATTVKDGVVNAVKHPIQTVGNVASTAGGVLKAAAVNPVTYQAVATALNEKEQQTGITIKNMAGDADVQLLSNMMGADATDVARTKYYNNGYDGLLGGPTGGEPGSSYGSDQFGSTGGETRDGSQLPDADVATIENPAGVVSGGGTTGGGVTPANVSGTSGEPLTSASSPVSAKQLDTTSTEPITTAKSDPVSANPLSTSDPVSTKKIDPVSADPVKTNPIETKKIDPVTADPVKTNPIETKKINPVSADPIKTNPISTNPISANPINTNPISTNPLNTTTTATKGTTGTHSGGGYGEDGYSSFGLANEDKLSDLDELIKGGSSIDEILKNSKVAKIPSSAKPISSKSSGKSSVIPIAAGLTVAAAAGIGAKAYVDHRNSQAEEDDEFADEDLFEDDEFETDDWIPDIDELEKGEQDLNAAGFDYNTEASTILPEGLAEA